MHKPVLLKEVLDYLSPQTGDVFLDVTAGFGGHAQEILKISGNHSGSVLIDRDSPAVEELRKKFADSGIRIIHKDFLSVSKSLLEKGGRFDIILADLGVSSVQLDDYTRGFSFSKEANLDMRMDTTQELTAADIVNDWSEKDIARILKDYSDEPKARQIASVIVKSRPIKTTSQLAEIAQKSWPGYSRVHPATRTFQALRIAVNSELEQLEQSLPIWLEMLKPSGRIAIISFHSLEDRIIKNFFAENSGKKYDSQLVLLTKKPVMASHKEIVSNPRARSAKLRAAAKIKTKRKENK